MLHGSSITSGFLRLHLRTGSSLRATETSETKALRRSVQDDRGKEKREHGSIQKETKYIGPSLRAIKPSLGNTVQALTQDGRVKEYRPDQTARLLNQKVTSSHNDPIE